MHEPKNRFNGFDIVRETVETVPSSSAARNTPLKRGVNENGRFVGHFLDEIALISTKRPTKLSNGYQRPTNALTTKAKCRR